MAELTLGRWLLVACWWLPACGGAAQSGKVPLPSPAAPLATQASNSLTLERIVVTTDRSESVSQLHARGLRELEQRDFNSAAADFELCVTADPDGSLAPSCLFHEGVVRDELGQFEEALRCFTRVLEQSGEHPIARQAMSRALRLLGHLERWDIAAPIAERLLAMSDLRPLERILPYGVLAMQRLFHEDDVTAEKLIAKARAVIEELRLDVPGKIHRDLATVYFALGEVHRLRAERVHFVPLPANYPERLEERCQLILDAQSAYSDAMRAFDAHWSIMAGYRVGELYSTLHAEVMAMLPQVQVQDAGRRKLLEGAMRLRYAVLVQKALRMMQQTIDMAERVGEQSDWLDKARAAQRELKHRAQAEEDAIAALPYSRESLSYALEQLRREAQGRPRSPSASSSP